MFDYNINYNINNLKIQQNININININNTNAQNEQENYTNAQNEYNNKQDVEKIEKILKETYTPKKINNIELKKIFEDYANKIKEVYKNTYYENKIYRLNSCADFFLYEKEKEEENYKLKKTNSCHVRLCPICSYKRSRSTFFNLIQIYSSEELKESKHYFLTLTQKNVSYLNTEEELKKINYAWQKLTKRKEFKKCFKGYCKSIELTINENKKEIHPHLHCILTADKLYGKNYYIAQKEFRKIWAEALNLDYLPQVNIKKINNSTKAILETAKYSIKTSDILKSDPKIIIELDKQLNNKRFISTGGVIKKIKKELKINNIEENEMLFCEKEKNEIKNDILLFKWHFDKKIYENITAKTQ